MKRKKIDDKNARRFADGSAVEITKKKADENGKRQSEKEGYRKNKEGRLERA